MLIRRWIPAVVAVLLVAACTSSRDPKPEPTELPSTGTPYPGGDWSRVDPVSAGFDAEALDRLDTDAEEQKSACVVVTRDGRLVHEAYWNGAGPTTEQPAYSATKSYTSVLVGIAADKGLLSLDDSAAKYIPEWKDTPAAKVTIRSLLANTSGRHWDLQTDYRGMVAQAQDKTAFSIDLKQDAAPGKIWAYNNSAIQTLSAILRAATGMEPAQYAKQVLFRPLRMSNTQWGSDASGHTTTFTGVSASCRDMARLGLLMMRDGRWNEKQVVSSDFVKAAVGQASSPLNAAYGLLWWVNRTGIVDGSLMATGGTLDKSRHGQLAPDVPADAFWALGFGKQIISVVPSKGIVAVRMGAQPTDRADMTPNAFTSEVLSTLDE